MSSRTDGAAASDQVIFRETLRSVLAGVSPAARQLFVVAVNNPTEDDLDTALWGPVQMRTSAAKPHWPTCVDTTIRAEPCWMRP